jgi:uncharacterized protein (DUF2147 family)
MGRRFTRARSAIVLLIAASALVAVLAVGTSAASSSKGRADSGTSFAAVDKTETSGVMLVSGYTTDKLFGTIGVLYKVKLSSSSGSFKVTANPVTLFTRTGSLSGPGSATLTIGSDGHSVTITNGTLKLGKGTGGQKGHRFAGTFTGSGDLQTQQYVFNYKGKYF